MGFKSLFKLFACFSILTGANCTPTACGCRPPCPPSQPPPCAPVVPIMLDNCGPNPCPLPPINAPPLQTPLVSKPPVALPACVPPTKTISNTCHCVKTVVKPQVVQQLISVPTVQRYIQTTHTPVVENIHYHGIPINCPPYAPEPPVPAPCAAPAPPPAPPCATPALHPLLAFAAPKPPAPTFPPGLLALLLASNAAPPACPPSRPALPPCMPCLPVPPAPSPPPTSTACLSLPPCLLSLLSKLL